MDISSYWGIAGLILLVMALCWPVIKRLGKLLLRTIGGLMALFLFHPVGSIIGVQLGINAFNALILGVLGVPGFGLLLLLHWVVS